jgi:diaminopimelate decarboxylase
MFTSNNTSEEEFREAAMHGGCILNLDGIEFVDKVPAPFPDLICFRLNPGTRKTGDEVNPIIGDPVKAKYGVPIEKIVEAYRLAMRRGAKRFGLHTMVCSNDRNYQNMVKTIRLLLEVAEELWRALGIELEFINMGGGIGIPYRPTDNAFDVEALAREALVLLDEFERRIGPTYMLPKFFTESGRYVTGPHGVLVTKVINRYRKYRDYIGVEVAMPGNMRPGIYGAYHGLIILNPDGSVKDGEMAERMVVGSICENCDNLTAEPRLLPDACVGDIAVSEDCGAHAPAMAFNYNGRTRPQRLLIREDCRVVRTCRAETYDDLIARTRGLVGEEHILRLH